jgi:DNA-3-methyladenine glycosylase I
MVEKPTRSRSVHDRAPHQRAVPAPPLGAAAKRCPWAEKDPLYHGYHDDEWGRPVVDDQRLFEKLALEGFQAGLSWLTILRKRDAFRRAFRGFAPATVARFDQRRVTALLADAGIVRHRGKIEAAIHNAARVRAIQDAYGSLAAFVWRFAATATRPAPRTLADVPATTPEAAALAAALRAHGLRFVGPTTVYAFMQAMGLVNDHLVGCPARDVCERERRRLVPPSTHTGRPVSSVDARAHGRLPSHQASRHLSARR